MAVCGEGGRGVLPMKAADVPKVDSDKANVKSIHWPTIEGEGECTCLCSRRCVPGGRSIPLS